MRSGQVSERDFSSVLSTAKMTIEHSTLDKHIGDRNDSVYISGEQSIRSLGRNVMDLPRRTTDEVTAPMFESRELAHNSSQCSNVGFSLDTSLQDNKGNAVFVHPFPRYMQLLENRRISELPLRRKTSPVKE